MLEELELPENPLRQRALPSAEDIALGIPGIVIGLRNTFECRQGRRKGWIFRQLPVVDRSGWRFPGQLDYTYRRIPVGISQFGVEYC
jgi:hypothetical protein